MSILDQAFIRAYSKEQSGNPPPLATTVISGEPPVVPTTITIPAPHVKFSPKPDRPASDVREPVVGQRVRIDAAHEAISARHAIPRQHSRTSPTIPSLPSVAEPKVNEPVGESLSSGSKLPASREALLTAPHQQRPRFRANWEVDRFAWPDVCDRALAQASDRFRDAGVELRNASRGGLRVLAVTSSVRGEGRTTISLSLARAVAMAGVRVVLLDADLDFPHLGKSLGMDNACGWEDVVHGEVPLSEAAVTSLHDHLTLLPLGASPQKRDFELSDGRVSAVLRGLADIFELVIVDMGPLSSADRRLFECGELCPLDAAVVVRDCRVTSPEQIRQTVARMKATGVQGVGVVENFL